MRRSIISIIITTVTLAVIGSLIDLNDLIVRARFLSPSIIITIFVLLTTNLFVISFRLFILLRHFRCPISFGLAFRANASGLVAGLLLINIVASILGRHRVLRRSGIDPALVALSSGYERIILALVSAGLAACGGLYLFGTHFIDDYFHTQPIVFIILAILIAALLVLATARSGYEKRMINSLRHPKRVLEVLEISGISLLSQSFNLAAYVLVIKGLNYDIQLTSLLAAAAIISFAASLPISINGWGVREVASIFALNALGVSTADAITTSVTVGVLNTFLVLMLVPLALWHRTVDRPAALQLEQTGSNRDASNPVAAANALDYQRIFPLVAGLLVSVLLFFQFPISARGTVVTLNLGDPIALLALGYTCTFFLFNRTLPFLLSTNTKIWLVMAVFAVSIGLLVGIERIGSTPWALGNRGIGLVVILGYFACGALMSGQFGTHGVRRLAQVAALAATTVVAVQLFFRFCFHTGLIELEPTFNFEGFSSNRNAFSYQLLTVFSVASALLLHRRLLKNKNSSLLTGFVVYGSMVTASLTGYITLAVLTTTNLLFGHRAYLKRILVPLAFGAATYVLLPYALDLLKVIAFQLGLIDAFYNTSLIGPRAAFNGNSVAERLESYLGGYHLWLAHPFLGGGIGSFIQSTTEAGHPLVIHSTYIWIIAEMGLLGAILLFAVPLIQIPKFWRAYRQGNGSRLGGLSTRQLGLVMLLIVFGVFSLTHDVAYQRIFWLFLGALLSRPKSISK